MILIHKDNLTFIVSRNNVKVYTKNAGVNGTPTSIHKGEVVKVMEKRWDWVFITIPNSEKPFVKGWVKYSELEPC